jgi:hypothetical protein
MAGVTLPDMRPWGRRPLTIPPNSANAWFQLAIWELWMGMLVCVVSALGVYLILTSPGYIFDVPGFTNCDDVPVPTPCQRTVYRGGVLNAAFVALFGLTLVGVAVWMLWELWTATEPKPITDDFLRLLHESFGSNWRNPLKWPWTRLLWAYGFTVVGMVMMAGVGIMIWTTLLAVSQSVKTPNIRIDTSESFRARP